MLGFKNCFGISSYRLMTLFSEFCSISALLCSFEFVVVDGVCGGGYSQRLLCPNPTTVMVVLSMGLLLGLWLLLQVFFKLQQGASNVGLSVSWSVVCGYTLKMTFLSKS